MMLRCGRRGNGWRPLILASIAGLLTGTGQTTAQTGDSPFISILLPPSVPSETVQISYFLRGSFGGYGDYVRSKSDVTSYEVPATVEGRLATEIRAIVYARGCEIQTFVIPVTENSEASQKFDCQPVRTTRLSGKIVPAELATDGHTELVIRYMAYWGHEFFGITDGAVTEFSVAKVSPAVDGTIDVDLPVLTDERSRFERSASFCLTLRDATTWNHVAYLEPEPGELRSEEHCLRIRSSYPGNVNFVSWESERTERRKKQVPPNGDAE